ncbi:MAG: hypothetical protein LBB45_06555 [Methanobrevibacter sp.]|jgi:hypothetical protein|nr:hypothetical protein [Candidatus Methanovirga basalitermitum]
MYQYLKRKFTLLLSGTTFNLRYDDNFEEDFGKNIYTFGQEEETKCKNN